MGCLRYVKATSFSGPFPWLGPANQGKGPGNEVDVKELNSWPPNKNSSRGRKEVLNPQPPYSQVLR